MRSLALLVIACAASAVSAWQTARLVMGALADKRRMSHELRLEDVLTDQILGPVLFCACAVVISYALALWTLPITLVCAYLLARRAPGLLEKRRAEQLRSSCDGQLDVCADIVAMGVRAGLSFDAALDLYCDKFSGELAAHLTRARTAWKSGMASREQALADLAIELDSKAMKRFADTAVQSIRYGSPLADMLTNFADELRSERHESVERQVARAPVKMLVPMGICILPAMLLLVMGPVILQFLEMGI